MVQLTPTTKLDAVNTMLLGIGGDSINSLENDQDADVSSALSTLNRVSQEIQTSGWKFNTDEDYPLVPSSGQISLPGNTLSFKISRSSGLHNHNIVERQRKLYNRTTHSYSFDRTVLVDIIFLFDFDDLPASARNYICMRATREFINDTAPSEIGLRTAPQDELTARAVFLRDQTIRSNMLKNKAWA